MSPVSVSRQENTPHISSVGVQYNAVTRKSLRLPRTRQPSLLPQSASETSFSLADVVSSKSGTPRTMLVDRNYVNLKSLPRLASNTSQSPTLQLLRKSWWMLPMFLAVVPLYCAVQGRCATMPHWWQVVKMDHIFVNYKHSLWVVGGFLGSNIAYFLSGTYLLKRFPFEATTSNSNGSISLKPTRFTMLGVWILAAGLVSTIFHSVQAFGSYPVAEALCYIDHGIAVSSGFYFLDTCGLPSRRVSAIGLTGIAALVFTYPGYAFLHSAWHFLSATAATLWAVEGHGKLNL